MNQGFLAIFEIVQPYMVAWLLITAFVGSMKYMKRVWKVAVAIWTFFYDVGGAMHMVFTDYKKNPEFIAP